MAGKSMAIALLVLVLTSGRCTAQGNPPPPGGGRAAGGENSPARGANAPAARNRRVAATENVQPAATQQPPAASDPRADDRAAIRATMQSFVKSFEDRDAQALAAHWTTSGEYQHSDGMQLQGRDTLQQAFAEFFAKTPEVTSQLRPSDLRFLSATAAIEEGRVTIRRGPATAAKDAHYSALLVREDEGWRIARLSESAAEDEVLIEDLNWLIGRWKSVDGQGAEIQTVYGWDAAKKFIHVQFMVAETERTFAGTQIIGLNPATAAIHSWTFEASGGVAEATWTRDGDDWILAVTGTLPEGGSLTQTNVLRRINDDTFTWQSVDRMVGDAPLADLPPVKVTRVKAEQ